MTAIISAITAIFNAAIGWVGDVADVFVATKTVDGNTVLAHPMLLLFLVIPLVGLGVGIFKRLLNVN